LDSANISEKVRLRDRPDKERRRLHKGAGGTTEKSTGLGRSTRGKAETGVVKNWGPPDISDTIRGTIDKSDANEDDEDDGEDEAMGTGEEGGDKGKTAESDDNDGDDDDEAGGIGTGEREEDGDKGKTDKGEKDNSEGEKGGDEKD